MGVRERCERARVQRAREGGTSGHKRETGGQEQGTGGTREARREKAWRGVEVAWMDAVEERAVSEASCRRSGPHWRPVEPAGGGGDRAGLRWRPVAWARIGGKE